MSDVHERKLYEPLDLRVNACVQNITNIEEELGEFSAAVEDLQNGQDAAADEMSSLGNRMEQFEVILKRLYGVLQAKKVADSRLKSMRGATVVRPHMPEDDTADASDRGNDSDNEENGSLSQFVRHRELSAYVTQKMIPIVNAIGNIEKIVRIIDAKSSAEKRATEAYTRIIEDSDGLVRSLSLYDAPLPIGAQTTSEIAHGEERDVSTNIVGVGPGGLTDGIGPTQESVDGIDNETKDFLDSIQLSSDRQFQSSLAMLKALSDRIYAVAKQSKQASDSGKKTRRALKDLIIESRKALDEKPSAATVTSQLQRLESRLAEVEERYSTGNRGTGDTTAMMESSSTGSRGTGNVVNDQREAISNHHRATNETTSAKSDISLDSLSISAQAQFSHLFFRIDQLRADFDSTIEAIIGEVVDTKTILSKLTQSLMQSDNRKMTVSSQFVDEGTISTNESERIVDSDFNTMHLGRLSTPAPKEGTALKKLKPKSSSPKAKSSSAKAKSPLKPATQKGIKGIVSASNTLAPLTLQSSGAAAHSSLVLTAASGAADESNSSPSTPCSSRAASAVDNAAPKGDDSLESIINARTVNDHEPGSVDGGIDWRLGLGDMSRALRNDMKASLELTSAKFDTFKQDLYNSLRVVFRVVDGKLKELQTAQEKNKREVLVIKREHEAITSKLNDVIRAHRLGIEYTRRSVAQAILKVDPRANTKPRSATCDGSTKDKDDKVRFEYNDTLDIDGMTDLSRWSQSHIAEERWICNRGRMKQASSSTSFPLSSGSCWNNIIWDQSRPAMDMPSSIFKWDGSQDNADTVVTSIAGLYRICVCVFCSHHAITLEVCLDGTAILRLSPSQIPTQFTSASALHSLHRTESHPSGAMTSLKIDEYVSLPAKAELVVRISVENNQAMPGRISAFLSLKKL